MYFMCFIYIPVKFYLSLITTHHQQKLPQLLLFVCFINSVQCVANASVLSNYFHGFYVRMCITATLLYFHVM